jgi:hypothetical protein
VISEESGTSFISVLEHKEFLDIVMLKLSLAGIMFSESTLPQYFTRAILIGLLQTIEVILVIYLDLKF